MLLHGAWEAELKCRGHRSHKGMLHFTTHCATPRFITQFGAVFVSQHSVPSFIHRPSAQESKVTAFAGPPE